MKKCFLLATALAAIVSCSDESFVGDQKLVDEAKNAPISFDLNKPAVTRADKTGSAAATDLSNQFIVYGEKNEVNAGETGANVDKAAGATGREGHLVFKNYLVDWIDNSAYTTTSNTKGWEYVGLKLDDGTASPATTTYSGHISPNSGTNAQTIKYWDFSANSYTFTAVSALPADITAGKVTITKTETGSTVYDKGYTVVLTSDAHLDNLFFSERQPISATTNKDRTQVNMYGGNVTFRFHNMASKVRVGMYETVPGYTVTINKFSVDNDGADPNFVDMTDPVTANFAANLQNCASGTAGTLTVKYVSSGSTINHPTVSFGGTKAKVLALGDGLKADVTIGETATSATYDKAAKAYTSVFPNETNAQNLKLKVSYTLTDPVTGETIAINDKTAVVPASYLKWKPGYAYTYLFKITDNDLYPITFDAVEVIAEDGSAEYITTVSEPSITTFGVKGGKYNVEKNEYEAGSDIYATIMDASAVKDFDLGTDVNVYLVTTSDAANFPITEASVAEALAEIATGTKKITYTNENANASSKFTAIPAEVTTVPGEDGVDITGTHALKLTGAVATTDNTAYAIEYIKTAATYHTTSEAHTFADASVLSTWEASHYKLYDNADGTTSATATNAEKTYYKRTAVKTVGTYAYKVIKVVAAP